MTASVGPVWEGVRSGESGSSTVSTGSLLVDMNPSSGGTEEPEPLSKTDQLCSGQSVCVPSGGYLGLRARPLVQGLPDRAHCQAHLANWGVRVPQNEVTLRWIVSVMLQSIVPSR